LLCLGLFCCLWLGLGISESPYVPRWSLMDGHVVFDEGVVAFPGRFRFSLTLACWRAGKGGQSIGQGVTWHGGAGQGKGQFVYF
jgi:hypothetical protein